VGSCGRWSRGAVRGVRRGAGRVEWRVEVGEFHLAQVLAGELGQLDQAGERIEGVAADQEVVLRSVGLAVHVPDGAGVVQQTDLGHPIVGRRDPLVGAILVGQQSQRLVGPGELQAPVVGWQAARSFGGFGSLSLTRSGDCYRGVSVRKGVRRL